MLPSHAVVPAIEPVELPPKCGKRERRSFRRRIQEGARLVSRDTRGNLMQGQAERYKQ